uniref:Uncharacterized protein n=1 Tax=Rhizophora mucronata TaxID=61149 RepID=A0A2P2PXV6_RHIMU
MYCRYLNCEGVGSTGIVSRKSS